MSNTHSPKLVFGAANFGFASYGMSNMISDTNVLQEYLDFLKKNGIDQIDTARRYGNGTSEEMLGLVNTANQGFILDSKVQSTTIGSHSRDKMRESVHKSLEMLKVKKVRLFYDLNLIL